jgi:hypothetical protein
VIKTRLCGKLAHRLLSRTNEWGPILWPNLTGKLICPSKKTLDMLAIVSKSFVKITALKVL